MPCCSGFEKGILVFVQIKDDEKPVLIREEDYLLDASRTLTLTNENSAKIKNLPAYSNSIYLIDPDIVGMYAY